MKRKRLFAFCHFMKFDKHVILKSSQSHHHSRIYTFPPPHSLLFLFSTLFVLFILYRSVRLGNCISHRKPKRIWQWTIWATQHLGDFHGHVHALGGVVRIQCRYVRVSTYEIILMKRCSCGAILTQSAWSQERDRSVSSALQNKSNPTHHCVFNSRINKVMSLFRLSMSWYTPLLLTILPYSPLHPFPPSLILLSSSTPLLLTLSPPPLFTSSSLSFSLTSPYFRFRLWSESECRLCPPRHPDSHFCVRSHVDVHGVGREKTTVHPRYRKAHFLFFNYFASFLCFFTYTDNPN